MWASFLGLIYQNTLFLQQAQGYSPLATGASTLPIAIISLLVAARLAPTLMDRIGAPWTLVAGNDKKHARVEVIETFCRRLDQALERDRPR